MYVRNEVLRILHGEVRAGYRNRRQRRTYGFLLVFAKFFFPIAPNVWMKIGSKKADSLV